MNQALPEAEVTLSNYKHHADFSLGRQDMILLQSIIVFASKFKKQDCVRAILIARSNEQTVPNRNMH